MIRQRLPRAAMHAASTIVRRARVPSLRLIVRIFLRLAYGLGLYGCLELKGLTSQRRAAFGVFMDAAQWEAARKDYAWGVGALAWVDRSGAGTLWCESAAIEDCDRYPESICCKGTWRRTAFELIRIVDC